MNNIEQHQYSELINAISEYIPTLQGRFSFEAQQVVSDILQNASTFSDDKWSQILKDYGNRSEVVTAIYDNQSSPEWVIESACKKQPVRMYQKEFLLKNNNTPDKILDEILFNYGQKEYLEFYSKNHGGEAMNNFITKDIIDELIQNNYRMVTPHKLIAIERCTNNDLINNFLNKCKEFEHINEEVLSAIVNNQNLTDENRLLAFEMGFIPEKLKRLPDSVKEEQLLSQIDYYKTIPRTNLETTPLTEFLKGLLENDTIPTDILITLFKEVYLNKGGPFYNQFQIFSLDVISEIDNIDVLHELSNHYYEMPPIAQRAFLENNNLDDVIKNTLLLNIIHDTKIKDEEITFFEKFIETEPLWDNTYETFFKRASQIIDESEKLGIFSNAIKGLFICIALSKHTPEKYLDEILFKQKDPPQLSLALASMQKIARLNNQNDISDYFQLSHTPFMHTFTVNKSDDVKSIEAFSSLINCIEQEINKKEKHPFVKDLFIESIESLLEDMKFNITFHINKTFEEKMQSFANDIVDEKAAFYCFVKNIEEHQTRFLQIKNNQASIEKLKNIKSNDTIETPLESNKIHLAPNFEDER